MMRRCTSILLRGFRVITLILFVLILLAVLQQTTRSETVTLLSVNPSYCCEHGFEHGCENILKGAFSQLSSQHNLHRCGILMLSTAGTTNDADDANDANRDSNWVLRSGDGDGTYQNIPAKVPGDIITDLYRAKIISHPYYENHFLNDAHVWMGENEDCKDVSGGSGVENHGMITKQQGCDCDGGSTVVNCHKRTAVTQNYYIPGLKARKRTWIYERNFSIPLPPILKQLKSIDDYYYNRDNDDDDINDIYKSMYVLVVEGIKMGAMIEINEMFLGNVTNQFKRYIFPIPNNYFTINSSTRTEENQKIDLHHLSWQRITHQIRISFIPEIDTNGRFMACSGGWDWAPYTQNAEASCLSRRAFTFGIVKPIYIAKLSTHHPMIVDVIPKLYYLGDDKKYSVRNAAGNEILNGDFQLVVDVHFNLPLSFGNDIDNDIEAPGEIEGEVIFRASFLEKDEKISMKNAQLLKNGTLIVTLHYIVKRKSIHLWWPQGVISNTGTSLPQLYSLKVAYHNPTQGTMSHWVEKKIGFRHVRLVTSDDFHHNNQQDSSNNEGNGFHGMYFQVNNKIIQARGANVVPMSQLEGSIDDESYTALVESAVKANMNMLRVWGGGMILPSSFYEACDANGILVYHDLMFVEEQFHFPIETVEVEDEIRHLIRSLIHHPSIILWNGCNECQRGDNVTNDIYSDFVMTVVSQEDNSRPIWPSSPSRSGWKTGVDRNSGIPNGNKLSYWLPNHNMNESDGIERHGPYLHGSSLHSLSSVNGHPSGSSIDTNIPIHLNSSVPIGGEFPNTFVSEFGASVYSSFESMSSFIRKDHWSLHGGEADDKCATIFENLNQCNGTNVMSQRNYPCDSNIHAFFGNENLHEVGETAFRRQLYLCMIAQTLWMKGEIEMKRSQNVFGLLIWQMNENWPTGGWGLVEYGANEVESGQVLGGRRKPLFYQLQRSLFRNVIASCGEGGLCYCRNDGISFTGFVSIRVFDLIQSIEIHSEHKMLALEEGSIEYFKLDVDDFDCNCNVIVLRVEDDNGNELMGEHVSLFAPPKQLQLPSPIITVVSIEVFTVGNVEVMLHSNELALFVFLSCQVKGQFEDNAFFMEPNKAKKIEFILSSSVRNESLSDLKQKFKESLKIQHLGGSIQLNFAMNWNSAKDH